MTRQRADEVLLAYGPDYQPPDPPIRHEDHALARAGQARAIALNGAGDDDDRVEQHTLPAVVATSATAIVQGLLAVAGAINDLERTLDR